MKISKKDALNWFTFFAALPEEEEIQQHQQEIIYARTRWTRGTSA